MSDLRTRLAQLAEEFRRSAPARIASARDALAALRTDPADREARERLFRTFHSLAGSGGTHGQPEVSRLGLVGEALLRSFESTPPGEAELTAVARLLDSLEDQFSG